MAMRLRSGRPQPWAPVGPPSTASTRPQSAWFAAPMLRYGGRVVADAAAAGGGSAGWYRRAWARSHCGTGVR